MHGKLQEGVWPRVGTQEMSSGGANVPEVAGGLAGREPGVEATVLTELELLRFDHVFANRVSVSLGRLERALPPEWGILLGVLRLISKPLRAAPDAELDRV